MNEIELRKELNEIKSLLKLNYLNDKEIWTAPEFQLYSGFSYSALTKMTSLGVLPALRPTQGKLFFERNLILDWFKNYKIYSEDEAIAMLKSHHKNKKV